MHRIKKHCPDKKYTELTGWLYKVYVEGDSTATIDDRERTIERGTRSAPTIGQDQRLATKRARNVSDDTSDGVDVNGDRKRNTGKNDKADKKQRRTIPKTSMRRTRPRRWHEL